jgi:hypothetical protein
MKTNIVSLFILIAAFGINSQNVIRIQENKIGEFPLLQLEVTNSILQNGLKVFVETEIEIEAEEKPFTVNNAYRLDIKKTGKKIEVKITLICLSKDFSQLCIGYFQIQEHLFFINKDSYKKLFKKTKRMKIFNFYETILIQPNGRIIKSLPGRAPTFYFYELTKNGFIFKEKTILN